jgi:hypothetical protein
MLLNCWVLIIKLSPNFSRYSCFISDNYKFEILDDFFLLGLLGSFWIQYSLVLSCMGNMYLDCSSPSESQGQQLLVHIQ